MVDVRGDVLRPPHGTTPAAVKSNKKSEMRSFKNNENIHKLVYDFFFFLWWCFCLLLMKNKQKKKKKKQQKKKQQQQQQQKTRMWLIFFWVT